MKKVNFQIFLPTLFINKYYKLFDYCQISEFPVRNNKHDDKRRLEPPKIIANVKNKFFRFHLSVCIVEDFSKTQEHCVTIEKPLTVNLLYKTRNIKDSK